MTAKLVTELVVGRVYRARKPANCKGFFNDRVILWMDSLKTEVQYDGPAVGLGARYPKVSVTKFLDWVGADVTNTLPENEWEPYK